MKYRKKPVVIDAVKFEDTAACADALADLEHGSPCKLFVVGQELEVQTLEGLMKAQLGDYIIRGVKGELYPCKPDIFEATYDRVED